VLARWVGFKTETTILEETEPKPKRRL